MNSRKRNTGMFGICILVMSLVLSTLACSFQLQQNDDGLKQTDIALAIQQTRVEETSAALVAQASWTPVPPTEEPPTPEPVVLTEAPVSTEPAPTQPEATHAPLVVTATPQPTPELSTIALTDWKEFNFVKVTNGCRDNKELLCWLNRKTGTWKSINKATYGSLTSNAPILISNDWPNPYLVFNHDMDISHFTAYVDFKIGSDTLRVKQFDKGLTGWSEQPIDLNPYKGKEIIFRFSSEQTYFGWSGVAKFEVEWYLQNIRIETNYQPKK